MPHSAPRAHILKRIVSGIVAGVTAAAVGGTLGATTASATSSPSLASVVVTAPVYNHDAPDPDIIRVGDTYYVYTTAGIGGNIPVLSSTDLEHWQYDGDALPVLPSWEKQGQTWAPGVVVLNGFYVMYYATERASDGEECISEATSPTPTGPFTDTSDAAMICQPNFGGSLDPEPFVDPDGTTYLYWKSNGGNGALPVPGDIWVSQLSANGSTLVGPPQVVLTQTQSWEATVENPFMVDESGTYVLFYSGGLWDSAGYGVSYAVCTGPLGPCTKPVSSPMLHSDQYRLGPGGESLVTDADGNWWMAYAAWDGPTSQYSYADGEFRSLWLAPVTFAGSTPDIGAGEAPEGYVMAAADGGEFLFGATSYQGSMAGHRLDAPVVGTASDGPGGYWEVASDGGVFAFGDAGYYGSMGGTRLARPVVGIAPTPDGRGYWLVASDGGVFAFGDAGYYGSMGGRYLARPVVGIAPTPDGRGYWEVASDGGVFTFGDAGYYGSMGGRYLARPVVGIAAMPQGGGYWEVASDGGVFAFGAAPYYGSMGGTPLARPVVALIAGPGSGGYWMVASDGGLFAFGDCAYLGSLGGIPLVAPVVGAQSG
jgi:hypothetical protein